MFYFFPWRPFLHEIQIRIMQERKFEKKLYAKEFPRIQSGLGHALSCLFYIGLTGTEAETRALLLLVAFSRIFLKHLHFTLLFATLYDFLRRVSGSLCSGSHTS